jgi:hypothetical protein
VLVAFGPKVPRGSLPVFSVADEEEARALLTQACPKVRRDEFVAEELVAEQTLDNLMRFSHRLAVHHDRLKAVGRCRCGG